MAQKPKTKQKKGNALPAVGLWATVWWGVSCFYIALLVWAGKDTYVALSGGSGSIASLSTWRSAIASAYRDSDILPVLLAIIVLVWVIGGVIWLRELKRARISYKAAFKDLFLTIR